MDNWYTSVQMCTTLSRIGLNCRGTIRANRALNPACILYSKQEARNLPRGSFRTAVSHQHRLVACSWLDGNVVNVLSTADSSETSKVKRRVGSYVRNNHTFYLLTYSFACRSFGWHMCPAIIPKYNKYMQGVDRHDQLRERFSMAKGHSFKKWFKKLAFALLDMAATNAYILWRKVELQQRRDPHMYFQRTLGAQLLRTDWEKYDTNIFYIYFISIYILYEYTGINIFFNILENIYIHVIYKRLQFSHDINTSYTFIHI
jgi:hypothetical protein